jgi:peptidoglycan/LPS O-acetylase OafA/YrhL
VTYRPDIDGLRAVAVLSVIAFHASPDLLPGGYVGVDVFFVISGFLITSIILKHLQKGDFSFLDFYARRAKRIFPALIVVLAAIGLYGWVILLRDEFQQLGKHIAAGAGFIANFALWQEAGYFDRAAATKPLLHLWSLGIEEQFYFLWPPLLVLLWKRKEILPRVVLAVGALSFITNVVLALLWQTSEMFYLPPSRFWELLLGGMLAYAQLVRRKEMSPYPNVQAVCGVALLSIALVFLDARTLYPGWWATLPTIGTFLLISAGPTAWINRMLLSSRPFVFVGLISYPLYLWHWPLLSYADILESGKPSWSIRLLAVGVAFVLSWLTYRAIEKPIRARPNRTALVLVPALAVVAALGLAVFSRRVSARSEAYGLEKIVSASAEWEFPGPRLKIGHTEWGYHMERSGVEPTVLFLGDSNIQQYYPRIDRLFTEHPATARKVIFVTLPACPPIPGIPKCAGQTERALRLAENTKTDSVVVAAAWWTYPDFTDPQKRVLGFRALENVLRDHTRLGRNVYLILPIPIGDDFDPSHLIVRGFSNFGIARTQVERPKVVRELQDINAGLRKVAETTGAIVVDPVDYVCDERVCPTLMEDGSPVYKDAGHLRPTFVRERITFLDSIVLLKEPQTAQEDVAHIKQ